MFLKVCLFVLAVVVTVSCDTPASCNYDDVLGEWILYETEKNGTSDIDCSENGEKSLLIQA